MASPSAGPACLLSTLLAVVFLGGSLGGQFCARLELFEEVLRLDEAHCYYYTASRMAFWAAEALCRREGIDAALVRLETRAEQDFIDKELAGLGYPDTYWTAARRSSSKPWSWHRWNGSAIVWEPISQTRFLSAIPADQDGAVTAGSGGWDGASVDDSHPVVCEKGADDFFTSSWMASFVSSSLPSVNLSAINCEDDDITFVRRPALNGSAYSLIDTFKWPEAIGCSVACFERSDCAIAVFDDAVGRCYIMAATGHNDGTSVAMVNKTAYAVSANVCASRPDKFLFGSCSQC